MSYTEIQLKLRNIKTLESRQSQIAAQILLLSNYQLAGYELQALVFEQLLHYEVFIQFMTVNE